MDFNRKIDGKENSFREVLGWHIVKRNINK